MRNAGVHVHVRDRGRRVTAQIRGGCLTGTSTTLLLWRFGVNPVPFQDVPTGELICTYGAFDQKFKRATLVLNHPNYQLNFTLTAATNVFDRLHAEWMRSMFSWEWQPAH